MVITLKHAHNDQEFVLLDTSLNNVMSVAGGLFGRLQSHSSTEPKVCVCDRSGIIQWLDAKDLKVVSIDGKKLNEFFYLKKN